MPAVLPARHVRTLFISDVHLGTRGCQADLLLDFLRHYDAETIYLIGDIVDGWRLRRNWYWPQSHNDVAQKLLRKARKGARLVYVPGNHDEFLRDYLGTHFGGIEVRNTDIHLTADGGGCSSSTATSSMSSCATRAGWRFRRLGLLDRAQLQHRPEHPSPQVRLFLLVALGVGEASRQERRELHRQIRGGARARGAGERHRRRHLRAYSLPRDAPRFRHRLLQLRRLGRELHGAGRASRRAFRDHPLDRHGDRGTRQGGEPALRTHRRVSQGSRLLFLTDAWPPQVNGVAITSKIHVRT